MNAPRLALALFLFPALALCGGCTGHVVRTITVESQPQGAMVWLNDKEVGRTPVTADFTWYGTYRVRLEKDGYFTETVYQKVSAPWYEFVGIDLLFETVIPGTRHDDHRFPPIILKPAKEADPVPLLERAEAFQKDALDALKAK
jgi:hypothetical protein